MDRFDRDDGLADSCSSQSSSSAFNLGKLGHLVFTMHVLTDCIEETSERVTITVELVELGSCGLHQAIYLKRLVHPCLTT